MKRQRKIVFVLLILLQMCALPRAPGLSQDLAEAIRVNVGYVEVCATVKDSQGHYIGGLTAESFRVYDNGQQQEIESFQNFGGEFVCAIVLDTTGSMNEALPGIKNAVMRLIDDFRPEDLFAVYSFNSSMRLVQEFSHDKTAAKRAVLKLQAGGATALFDTISQVTKTLEFHKGKVALVVFTDGSDNASSLTINSAIERVKRLGMPLYTVAEGEALRNRKLLDQLQLLATTTGGASYVTRNSRDVEQVFSDISQELQNTYMLGYYAPPGSPSTWRKIQVSIPALKDANVRTKKGYYPRW